MDINDTKRESKTTWHVKPSSAFRDTDVELIYCALCLGGESGELQNLIKKSFRKRYYTEGHSMEDEKAVAAIADELADVMYYTSRIADILNIDMEKAFMAKMETNRARYNKP